ncbi:hypothetical protein EVAR_60541_1 [Eumeta japonica]|uniref:Uncharacterized protein n=1 Tax=Eumeta variegata TaxID=151549 RepID=A0A4C1YUI5_EUMVA|nr:hypothetical protein EVAR_60541_1 [Eumeta japonica]
MHNSGNVAVIEAINRCVDSDSRCIDSGIERVWVWEEVLSASVTRTAGCGGRRTPTPQKLQEKAPKSREAIAYRLLELPKSDRQHNYGAL